MVRTEWINSKGDYYYKSACGYTYTKEQQIQTFIIVEDDVLGKCALLKRGRKLTSNWTIDEYSLPCEHVDQNKQDKIKTTITELISQLFVEKHPTNISIQDNHYVYGTRDTFTFYYTSSINNWELKDPKNNLLYPLDPKIQSKIPHKINIERTSSLGLKNWIRFSTYISTIKNQGEIPVPYEKSLFKRFVKKLKNLLS